MSANLTAVKSLMHEALTKSLDEFNLERVPAPSSPSDMLKTRLLFEGSGMKAQSFVSCSKSFLQTTCPLPKGESGHPAAVLRDWLGELGNLILGRLKNRLLAHGVTIKISAPSFDGQVSKSSTAQTVTAWYQINQSFICFECLIEGVIPEIGEALKQTAEILPGDAIYRLNDPADADPGYDIISKIRSGLENQAEDDDGDDEVMVAPQRTQATNSAAHVQAAETAEKPQTNKPVKILFHTQAQANKPVLTGIAWSQLDKLTLNFSSGLAYCVCPKTLLERGCSTLEVEGLTLQLQKDGETIRVSIPSHGMQLSKSSRVS